MIPLELRLLAKVDRLYGFEPEGKPELGPCWPYEGAKNADGYGIIRGEPDPVVGSGHKGAPLLLAHRVALSIALGRPLDEGMLARHRCNFRPCCRPRHLREGTSQDNVDDMIEDGRWKKPPIKQRRIG